MDHLQDATRPPKPRLALLINLIAPGRVPVYEGLGEFFDLIVLHGGMESNRPTWKQVELKGVRSRRTWGFQFSLQKRNDGQIFDRWFLHVEPGYIFDLIRERPDAIITDEMGVRTLAALIYGTVFRKPVWVWWGGTLHTERHAGWARRVIRTAIAAWARHWISYGETSTEYLLSLGIERNRILQSQNSVDDTHFRHDVPPLWNIFPKPVILHIGQMIPRKGIGEFLQAVERLQSQGLEFSTILVGTGSDHDRLLELASSLHLQHVTFYPPQAPDKLPAVYRTADVVVIPTKEDVWGLVANEAVLCGVPVLCSRYAGCAKELFDSDQIFDPNDEELFVNALRRAVTGQLQPADQSRLQSSSQVADTIAEAIMKTIRSNSCYGTGVPNNQLG